MVSTPQTPTHSARAKFRTEVTSSTQMLIFWASFKSERGTSPRVPGGGKQSTLLGLFPGSRTKGHAHGEGRLERWRFYWHKGKPLLMLPEVMRPVFFLI